MARAPRSASLEERLALHSEPYINKDTCQLWQGARTKKGYGNLWWDGRAAQVPRLVWEVEVGPIPLGMEVCHTCDNPPCRNVDHLFVGTRRDNMADKVAKGREAHPYGETNGRAKLTAPQVIKIRAARRGVSYSDLAAIYGVSKTAISLVRSGSTWRHLLDRPGRNPESRSD